MTARRQPPGLSTSLPRDDVQVPDPGLDGHRAELAVLAGPHGSFHSTAGHDAVSSSALVTDPIAISLTPSGHLVLGPAGSSDPSPEAAVARRIAAAVSYTHLTLPTN